ncbi:MAG TPA: VanZ family protein, partial [Lachnospiraceae bacterium]|nr:VanZ family protein [Lachnospiraceae bacterium]
MNNLFKSIVIAIQIYPLLAVCFTLPILLIPIIRYKKFNFMRIGLNYTMIFYFVCLFSLVFFPLPSTEQIASLKSHSIQLIPFRFIADILRETPFVFSNPHTYLPALFHRAVLQVVFNVLMMLPFGMILRYYFGLKQNNI